jgi:hypothetical protein
MKQAFIEIKNGLPINTDIMCAAEGFEQLGYQIRTFERTDILTGNYRLLYNKCPFIGSIDSMKSLFKQEQVMPEPIDFPEGAYLGGRDVRKCRLNSIVTEFLSNGIPVFIKPVETKLFSGMVLREISHLNYFQPYQNENPECWATDVLNIISEWRVYVYDKEIVDVRLYSGSVWEGLPDERITYDVVESYRNSPIAYTVDMGVCEGTVGKYSPVIEFNDFWSIGSYGLEPKIYAKMLESRFREIMK